MRGHLFGLPISKSSIGNYFIVSGPVVRQNAWMVSHNKARLLTSQLSGRTKRKGEIGDPLCSSRAQPHPMMLLHFTVNLLLNASATSHLPMTPRGGIQIAKA